MRIVILHKKVYEFLLKSGIDCDYDEDNDEIKIYITIENINFKLLMKFPRYYPYEFPEVYIDDTKGLIIPHMYTNNRLCLYDTNEVLPNPQYFLEDALDIVLRAKRLLIESKKRENIIDYQIENVSFWEAKAYGRVDYLGDRNLTTHLLWRYEWLEEYNIVANDREKIAEFISNSYGIKPEEIIYERALFINIGKKVLINLKKIADIQELIPKSDLSTFYEFLCKNSGKGLIILYADNGNGKCLLSLEIGLSSYGFKLSRRNIKGILAANKGKTFKKFITRNYQMQRLFTRGGDGNVSFDKRCLLMGCGSIGSYVSKAIIDIGITDDITLLDNDLLEVENLARHLCGSDYLCLPTSKVEALKSELLKHYPAMKCRSIEENACEFILNRCIELNSFDLILICVGNTLIEKKVIQLLKEKQIKTECMILWVEPYLVAGHALVFRGEIDPSTEKHIFDINGRFNNNVLVESKKYLKSEAGCQSAYAPYAGFEAQKFVLDFLDVYYRKIYTKKEKHNYEFTWIGKMKWARQQKFEIKAQWRSKEDRFMELKRIDNECII